MTNTQRVKINQKTYTSPIWDNSSIQQMPIVPIKTLKQSKCENCPFRKCDKALFYSIANNDNKTYFFNQQ